MKLTEYIKRMEHLKTDVTHHKTTSFRRWMEEYDKAYGLKPIP